MAMKVHSVTSRTKDLNSLTAKADNKHLRHPFQEINDIVGLRVVCLFMGDIPRVGEIIQNAFNVISQDDKIEGYDARSFGYMSIHYIVTMKKQYSGPRYARIANLPFEIQVRTIAMEAWATISHYLDYKTEKDIPDKLRKDFYALSGLFYIADKHFETFYNASQIVGKQLTQAFDSSNPPLDLRITADTLDAYLHAKFPTRYHHKPESRFVDELSLMGLTEIGQIDDAIRRGRDAFLRYERDNKSVRSSTQGATAVILSLVYPKFKRVYHTTGAYAKYRKFVIQ